MGNKPSTPGDVKPVTMNENNITTNNVGEPKKINEIQQPASTTDHIVPPPNKHRYDILNLWGGNHDKVVVVKLWAKWCGHCQAFEPEWKKMVKYFSKNPRIIFEHLEDDEIIKGGMTKLKHKYGDRISDPEGFPTFYIFRSSDTKKQIPYHGDRTFIGMKKEIEKLLMHGGGHNQTVKKGGAKKEKRKTMHRKRR